MDNKKVKMIMSITAVIVLVMIGKAFIFNEAVKGYLVTFFFVGAGLAMLRLFINGMIRKMKGKHIGIKVAFFATLLSIGLPFQNWFRKDVLFAMSKSFIVPCIIVLVASVIFMTFVYGAIGKRVRVQQ